MPGQTGKPVISTQLAGYDPGIRKIGGSPSVMSYMAGGGQLIRSGR